MAINPVLMPAETNGKIGAGTEFLTVNTFDKVSVMKTLSMLSILLLVGCTSDHYVNDYTSQEQMKADLKICHKEAFDYYNSKVHPDPTGAIVGGILGGAIGGAIAGAITSPSGEKPDINKMTQDCMQKKHYTGESHGYN